ncbi:hypothetical protein [Synechococcus sp. PCC 7502]|uniref:hypothetical protein n=1 Tax=Synechococcus sp. PCC 7502 TaxID=1173263 RepID=UPI00143A29BF|nr:hypothetical protein [Synechococcus sp. PCC 7502]
MDYKEIAQRIRLRNDCTRTANRISTEVASNPAVVSIYAGKDAVTGLVKTVLADG